MEKLEAVNIILDTLMEDQVSSLTSGLPDAEAAERLLDEVSRDVQADGYHCNTDEEFVLTPDTDGNMNLPSNCLHIDTSGDDEDRDVVQRGTKLYDRDEQTFTFDGPLTVRLVSLLDFADLPYRLAYYIAVRAARTYQEREMGSVSLDTTASRKEAEAKAKLEDTEADADDANVLRQSKSVMRVAWRRNPNYGR